MSDNKYSEEHRHVIWVSEYISVFDHEDEYDPTNAIQTAQNLLGEAGFKTDAAEWIEDDD